jgi:hypothetical protein
VSGGGSTRRLEIHNHGEMDLSGANEVHLGGDFPSNSTVYVRNEGNLEFGVGTIRADAIDNLASLHLMGGSLTVLQRLRLLAGSDFIGHGTLALENSSSGTHILHDNFAQFSGEIRAVGNTHFQAGLDTDASLALVSNLTLFDKDVAVRGDVSIESGTKSFSSNSTFSGAFDLLGGSVLTSGTMRLDGPSSISGGSIGGSGNLVVTDLLAIDGGALSGNGSLIVEQTGNTSIGGDSAMTIARTIQNDGMIDVHGTGIVHVTRTVVNAGSLQVFGSGLFDGGGSNTGHVSIEAGALLRLGGDWSFAASSTVDARGVLELLGGHFTFEGDDVLSVANSLVITEDASVRVSGLNSLGHVISDGELFFLDSVAQVFDGFEQSLTGALTLASSIDGDSASLDVGGQVNLDGALILDFQNTPRGLEVIELHIIEAASVNGAFSSVNAVGLPKGFAIDLEYSATSVTAFVTVPSPTSMVMLLIGAATTSRRRRST